MDESLYLWAETNSTHPITIVGGKRFGAVCELKIPYSCAQGGWVGIVRTVSVLELASSPALRGCWQLEVVLSVRYLTTQSDQHFELVPRVEATQQHVTRGVTCASSALDA